MACGLKGSPTLVQKYISGQRRAVQQARADCAREGRGPSGALIADPSRLDFALLEQAELKGEYCWWTITL